MSNCTFRKKFNIPDDLVFSKEHIDSLYRLIAKNLPADIPKELWLQNVIYRGNTITISSRWLDSFTGAEIVKFKI
jgi:Tfp pilus assembly protein PilN